MRQGRFCGDVPWSACETWLALKSSRKCVRCGRSQSSLELRINGSLWVKISAKIASKI